MLNGVKHFAVQQRDQAAGARFVPLLARAAVAACLAAALCAVAMLAMRVTPLYDAGVTGAGGRATNKIGFYGVEYTRAGEPFRWTSGYAFVQMPYAFRAAPAYLATVRLRAENPAGPQPLTFLLNERPLATATPAAEFRTYHLALPPPATATAELRLALSTTPFRPAENPRPLGVIVSSTTLRPVPLVDWPLLLTLALGPAALLLLPRRGLASATERRERREKSGEKSPSVASVPSVASLRADLLVAAVLGAALLLLAWRAQPAPLRLEWMAWMAIGAAAVAWLFVRPWPARLGLALLCALVAFSGALWPSWLTDDAFISFRYAQNLVAGNGLVYNPGERVEGYTNFLWTVLAAGALALGGDIVVATYVAGIVLALALVLGTYAAGRLVLATGWALIAALLVATCQSLLVYTARGGGLETGLFTLLALAASAAYITLLHGPARNASRLAIAAGALFGLATLTRPEGALLLALTLLHSVVAFGQARFYRTAHNQGAESGGYPPTPPFAKGLYRSSQNPIEGSGAHPSTPPFATLIIFPFLALVLPFFVWRLAYYGDPLPNTFYVKTDGGPDTWLLGLAYLAGFARDFGGPLLLFAPLSLLLGKQHRPGAETATTFVPSRLRDFVVRFLTPWPGYLLLLCVTYSAYVVSVGGDHFPGHRFLVPLVPWLALLIAAGMAHSYALLARTAPGRQIATVALGVLLVLYSGYALGRSQPYDTVLAGNDESLWLWAEIGYWLHDNTAPDESAAALGAGAIAYYSDRTVIDLLGLTERHIARVPATPNAAVGHEKRDPDYVLNVRRPTYIPRIWDDYFGGAGALRERYELITVQTRYGREIELWRLRQQ
jgi:hypothetical protein